MEIPVVEKVLKLNDDIAAGVRKRLLAHQVCTLNIISAPGSGKTTLLERSFTDLKEDLNLAVIEGDPDTTLDAERIAKHDVPVVQIETAGGCHLEANLVDNALNNFDLDAVDLLFIENVGNLVCPCSFDLGETCRVGIVSTPEGHDKPAKYPRLFKEADVIILNKIDLLPYLNFDVNVFREYIRQLNPAAPVLELSCTTGEGLDQWIAWLKNMVKT